MMMMMMNSNKVLSLFEVALGYSTQVGVSYFAWLESSRRAPRVRMRSHAFPTKA